MYYNAVKPLNIKPLYSANDIVDFTLKLRPGRAVKAGSMRVSGYLNIQKQAPGSSDWVPCTKAGSVFVSPFAGVCSVNDRVIEQNSMYPRWASMVKQSKLTLEGINTSSMATLELCGTQNNVALLGSEVAPNTVTLPGVVGEVISIPFSFHPELALNKCSADLGQSRFPQMKILFNLCSAIEALYSTAHPDYIDANIASLQYSFLDLQLAWYETVEVPSRDPVTFQTVSLITQTLISSNATFAVNSPTLYDAISMSFRSHG